MEDYKYTHKFDDGESKKSGSVTTIGTTEETPGTSRMPSFHYGGMETYFLDGAAANQPYTMAGIGLTGEDEDPCKIDKIKSRESDEVLSPADVSHEFWNIHYASEGNSYTQWMKSQRREKEEHHRGCRTRHPKDYHFYAVDPELRDIYDILMQRAHKCVVDGEKIENRILTSIFQDREFGKYDNFLLAPWLPFFPQPEPTYLQCSQLKTEEFVRQMNHVFRNLLYGCQQIVASRPSTDSFHEDFQRLVQDTTGVLADYTKLLKKLNIKLGPKDNEVKEHDFPVLKTDLGKNLHDYVTAKTYVKCWTYICRTLGFLRYEFT